MVYFFFTNIRAAWRRWNAAGHSIYGDLKSRMSPHIASSDVMPNAPSLSRRVSERPVPLTLPSRKSSQHLNGLGSGMSSGYPTPRSARSSAFALRTASSDHLGTYPANNLARSAPVSPTSSPRPSWSDAPSSHRARDYYNHSNDIEADYDVSPSLSRRSSFIYMNGNSNGNSNGHDATPTQRSVTAPIGGPGAAGYNSEPSSYFLPIPGSNGLPSQGLGITAPHSGLPVRRSSSNLSSLSIMSMSNANTPSPYPQPHRRVTAPRMLSTADWQSAAKAKDKTVMGILADSLPAPLTGSRGRAGGWSLVKGFLGWLWRSRNGVVGKSWRECLAVAWPAAVVWVLVNALFFWS
jgi:hypothetical protein